MITNTDASTFDDQLQVENISLDSGDADIVNNAFDMPESTAVCYVTFLSILCIRSFIA